MLQGKCDYLCDNGEICGKLASHGFKVSLQDKKGGEWFCNLHLGEGK